VLTELLPYILEIADSELVPETVRFFVGFLSSSKKVLA
jgi:hypothetical protein